MHRYSIFIIMSLKHKVILATMIIRGVATFGLMAYTMVNFVRWMMESNQDIESEYSEENLEYSI